MLFEVTKFPWQPQRCVGYDRELRISFCNKASFSYSDKLIVSSVIKIIMAGANPFFSALLITGSVGLLALPGSFR